MSSETNEVPVLAAEKGEAAGEVDEGRSRRDLLKALGLATAGAVVGSVLSPKEAQAHGTIHADSTTLDPAIHGNNYVGGNGVQGDSPNGWGVAGSSISNAGVRGGADSGRGVAGVSTSGTGVEGSTQSGIGVDGFSNTSIGVVGTSNSGTGVQGRSNSSGTGVEGRSDSGRGVQGISNSDVGVHGTSNSAPGLVGVSTQDTGVLAVSAFGDALHVFGPARFDTAGAGSIPAGQKSVTVNETRVTAQSHITMTLTGNPGSTGSGLPAVLVWVQRQPGTGFTAHLSRPVASATPFTYLIVEPS